MQKQHQNQFQNPIYDPILSLPEEAIHMFLENQKDKSSNYKSKGDKKKQKQDKIKKDINDPELKKARNAMRRQAEKVKLQAILNAMTKEEAEKYLNDRRLKKRQLQQKVRKNMDIGQPFLIDLVFEDKMNEKQNKSLSKQIQLIMKAIKHVDDPPSIHLCSFKGGIKDQLVKMRYEFWPLTVHEEDIQEIGSLLGKKLIYLSPDAELPLEKVDKDHAFILGGLIDRTIIKNVSLKRAQELGIEARKLPIRQFMKSRIVLNLDHVVNMVCKFKETNNWKQAFDFGAPKRWKRDGEQKKEQQNVLNESSDQQSDDDKKEESEQESQIKKQ